ncbi:MAG: hypothetical protein HPY66_3607 [Firmicutes bacterium]|nr:hypothetical protein [Bacillota bacterium]
MGFSLGVWREYPAHAAAALKWKLSVPAKGNISTQKAIKMYLSSED